VPVSVESWAVEYASATGEFNQSTDLLGVIPANGYYLVAQSQGTGGSLNLPTPDASGGIAMSATAGKVRLLRANGVQLDLVIYSGLSNTTASSAATRLRRRHRPTHAAHSASPKAAALPAARAGAEDFANQGPGLESPHKGLCVVTRGIVTQLRSNGFYIESQSRRRRQRSAASEASSFSRALRHRGSRAQQTRPRHRRRYGVQYGTEIIDPSSAAASQVTVLVHRRIDP
jgi:hypothetical protein